MAGEKPRHILVVDVETTGLTYIDRVITLGMVGVDLEALRDGAGDAAVTVVSHTIHNPGRPSNPFAAAVHGYDDWTLRHQPDFLEDAAELYPHFMVADAIIAHNAAFDERFIRAEFRQGGLELKPGKFLCTMRAWRSKNGAPAGLDPIIQHMGMKTRGKLHGALDDALYCLKVHLHLENEPDIDVPGHFKSLAARPSNYVETGTKPIRGARKVHSF